MTPVFATVVIDPPSTLFVGGIVALVSTKLIRRDPEKELRTAMLWAAAWAAWFGVCVAWPFFKRPDWMFVYLLDAQKVPLVPAYLLFVFCLVVYAVIGALAVGLAISRGKLGFGVALTVAAIIVWGGLFGLTFDQYMVVGTHAQYVAGAAPKLQDDHDMVMGMNAMTGGIAVFSIALLILKINQLRKLK